MSKITVDELIALNDEIRGLVRAGVPLDQGLRLYGSDLPGRLGKLAQSLSEGLSQGKSLVEVVDDSRTGLPRLYRAVVAAGLRSGRLAAALEGLTNTARRVSELRRTVLLSMIYPTFLVYLAAGLLTFTALKTAPVLARAYTEFGLDVPAWYSRIEFHLVNWPLLLTSVWLSLTAAIVIYIYSSRQAVSVTRRGSSIVGFGRLRYLGRLATYADVLALLIEHEVPLDEAMQLAAEASGDHRLQNASDNMIQRIRNGSQSVELPRDFPPLLAWQIMDATNPKQLVRNLRQTAENYHRRALRMGEWMSAYLPIVLASGIGGALVLVFGLIVIAPFYHLVNLLTLP